MSTICCKVHMSVQFSTSSLGTGKCGREPAAAMV
jgi:hypothetical protein